MEVGGAMTVKVVSVEPTDLVQTAIDRMLEENVGSVVVCDAEGLKGIFTERDVMRLAGAGTQFAAVRIGDVMTRDIVTVRPDDDILAAARLMQERRIRHLPVVEGGNVLGVLGIREALRTCVERLWSEHDPEAHRTARELLKRQPASTEAGLH
jgi:CBS domain-containing protein